jgi:hypothetical protein
LVAASVDAAGDVRREAEVGPDEDDAEKEGREAAAEAAEVIPPLLAGETEAEGGVVVALWEGGEGAQRWRSLSRNSWNLGGTRGCP